MSVAIISYNTDLIEKLTHKLNGVNYQIFGDSLEFIKNYNQNFNTIVYDASSGIFAEDDLRYLLNKIKNKDTTYYVLISTENPIDVRSLDAENIEVLNKNKDLEVLKEKLTKISTNLQSKENTNQISIEDIENNLIDKENYIPELEFNDLSLDLDSHILEQNIQKNDFEKIEFEDFGLNEVFEEKEQGKIENSKPTIMENNLLEIEDKSQLAEEKIEYKKPVVDKVSLQDVLQKSSEKEEKTQGKDISIADFNIKISSEDLKKLVLDIVRDYIKNDPAMHTIIDHLQIDFQQETMKELENLKNQLSAKLREEAEKSLGEEISKIIKSELKDYIAEISAKIVREKLEHAFKSF